MAKRTSRPGIGPFLWAAALLGWVGIALADVWDPIDQSSFAKLDVSDRTAAVTSALRHGLL